MHLNKKATCVLLSLILFIGLLINITTVTNGHNWENSDFAGYIMCARSIVDGTVKELFSMDRFLIENSNKDVGTIIGPWGFPVLLSPVYYFFGLDIYAMKVYVSLFFLLSLWIIFLIFQDRLSYTENLLLVASLAFNPWFFDFKENILSDIPFLFFSLLSLFLIKRFIILNKIWINKLFSFSLIGILIFISYNIRTVGLILLPILLSVQYIENRSSTTNNASILSDKSNYIPYLIFIIFSVVMFMTLPGGETTSIYVSNLSKLNFSRMIFDIKYYTVLPSRFFPFLFLNMHGYGFEYNKFSLVIYAVMLLFVFLGMVKNLKNDYMFFLYILLTLPVILLFSSRQGFRLLIPVFPFFLYFLYKGLSALTLSLELVDDYNHLKIRAVSLFGFGLVLVSLFYIAHPSFKNFIPDKTETSGTSFSNDSVELFEFIKTNTDKTDSIIFFNPKVMSLFTNRRSFDLSAYTFKFEQLFTTPAKYIAYDKKDNAFKLTVQDLRNNFECPFENETFLLCSLSNNFVN